MRARAREIHRAPAQRLCSLLASDVLPSEHAVTRALAAAGLDPEVARHMPNGAIWSWGELDKQGYEDVAPLSTGARKALDLYLRTHPRVGDVPMFPKTSRPDEPMRKMDLSWLLRRARGPRETPASRARRVPQLPAALRRRAEAPSGR